MAVIREGGTDPGSLKGRKGGTKGTEDFVVAENIYTPPMKGFFLTDPPHFWKF